LNAKRLVLGVCLGLAVAAGGILVLSKAVGASERVFQGKSAAQWRKELSSGDAAASHPADIVLKTAIIPELTDAALHDTNDSSLKLSMVAALNDLPGVRVSYPAAVVRRGDAVRELGKFGPAAEPAIPILIQILKGHDDEGVRGAAAAALGEIHSDPDLCIPVLIASLEDSDVDEEAAEALGKFGALAEAAVPKLLFLSIHGDKETRHTSTLALPFIDPEAAAKAGRKKLKINLHDH
jgi:hypothetical protein